LRKRGYGAGDCRIGSHIECGEDIYSLGFICQIRNDLISEHFDVLTGQMRTEKEKKKRIYTTEMLYDEPEEPAVTTTDSENEEKKAEQEPAQQPELLV
jgi:hypothetical protein